MSDDRESGASGIILSFLLGGLTGAALAILFAPRSGEETRERIGGAVEHTGEQVRRARLAAREAAVAAREAFTEAMRAEH